MGAIDSKSFGRNHRNAVNTQICVLHLENSPTHHLKEEVDLGDPRRTEKCSSILENRLKK